MRPPPLRSSCQLPRHVTRGQGHVTRRIPLLNLPTCWDDLGWGPGPVVPAADLADLSLAFYTPPESWRRDTNHTKKCFEKGISFQIWLVGVYLLLNFGGRGVFRHYLIFQKKTIALCRVQPGFPCCSRQKGLVGRGGSQMYAAIFPSMPCGILWDAQPPNSHQDLYIY